MTLKAVQCIVWCMLYILSRHSFSLCILCSGNRSSCNSCFGNKIWDCSVLGVWHQLCLLLLVRKTWGYWPAVDHWSKERQGCHYALAGDGHNSQLIFSLSVCMVARQRLQSMTVFTLNCFDRHDSLHWVLWGMLCLPMQRLLLRANNCSQCSFVIYPIFLLFIRTTTTFEKTATEDFTYIIYQRSILSYWTYSIDTLYFVDIKMSTVVLK